MDNSTALFFCNSCDNVCEYDAILFEEVCPECGHDNTTDDNDGGDQ